MMHLIPSMSPMRLSQYLGSASMTYFLSFSFLASSFVLSLLVFLMFSLLFFPASFIRFLVYSLLSFLFFSMFLFSNEFSSAVRMSSDSYYVQYIHGRLPWVASGIPGSRFSGASSETYAPV